MDDVRTAVVTGAASGIGRALATVLTGRGYRVTLTDVDAGGLEIVRAALDGPGAVVADVGDPAAVQRLAETTPAPATWCAPTPAYYRPLTGPLGKLHRRIGGECST